MKRVMNLLDIISLIRLKHFYIGLLILKKFDFNNRTFKKLKERLIRKKVKFIDHEQKNWFLPNDRNDDRESEKCWKLKI